MKQLRRRDCAILTLVLKGKWYDMIASGEKKEEYREIKSYWVNRIVSWIFSPYRIEPQWRIVAFSRGYQKPTIFFYARTVQTSDGAPSCRKPHPEWGEPETPHFIISLGGRVELMD